jgi:hypothetical protein
VASSAEGRPGPLAVNAYSMLAPLQGFVERRQAQVSSLDLHGMLDHMLAWYVALPPGRLLPEALSDDLVYRYGGWSEGCATGFKVSLLRRLRVPAEPGETEWLAGISVLFEPSGRANLARYSTASSDWPSLPAFRGAVESSPAFRQLAGAAPMAAALEGGGLR